MSRAGEPPASDRPAAPRDPDEELRWSGDLVLRRCRSGQRFVGSRAPRTGGRRRRPRPSSGWRACTATPAWLLIEEALTERAGVRSAAVDLDSGRATVGYDPSLLGVDELRSTIEEAGYSATPVG